MKHLKSWGMGGFGGGVGLLWGIELPLGPFYAVDVCVSGATDISGDQLYFIEL